MKTLIATLASLSALPVLAQNADYRPHMDDLPNTFWEARAGVALPAKTSVKGWDDLWVWETSGRGEFFFYEHPAGGDIEVGTKWDAWILNGFDGISSGYPLVAARLYARYSQRYQEGFGLNFLAEPGLYSALEQFSGKDFAFPFGITAEKAFTDGASLQLGAMIYPGFDQTVDPRVSLRLTNVNGLPADNTALTLDLGYPETKLTIKPDPNFAVRLGASMMTWAEFQMGEDDKRERLMYDETRVFGGVEYDITDTLNISLDVGFLLGREIEFENSTKPLEIDDTPFFRIGLQGRL